MKVLYCILDNRFGGPHRLAMDLAERLREHDVETFFLLGQKTDEPWRPDGFQSFLLRHIQCFVRRRPLLHLAKFCCFLPCNLLRIRRILKSHRIDVVHIDGVTNFVPALAAGLTRTPIVWLYNDHLLGPLKRLLLPLLTHLATIVVVQGECLRQSRTGGHRRLLDKTVVLYSAVDPDKLGEGPQTAAQRRRVRDELGIPADCTLIGSVGNVNRFKGYTYLVEAAARIKRQLGAVKFVVVGRKLDSDPGYWDRLEQLARRLGLEGDILYTGFREDVPAILAALDLFVLPSVLESCPVAVLEAMAMKRPVVATDVGAVSELVIDGRTGLLVPSGDSAALADAVVRYLRKPPEEIDEMLRAARARVETVFSLREVAERQRRLYDTLAAQRRR